MTRKPADAHITSPLAGREGASPAPPASPYLCLLLPFPPSVNSIIKCFGSRRVKTAAHKTYLDDACRALKKQPRTRYDTPVDITLSLGRPDKRKRDLDNHAKAVLDALCTMEIIEDDSLVERLTLQWDNKIIGCMVEIEKWDSAGVR